MKDSIQRICIAVVSFCSAFIIYIIVFREWPVVKEILSSLTTLIAAFCGAWFAFSLQNRAKKDEETGRRISKCNQALFILWQQTNNLMLIQKNIIDPCRGLPLAHIAMRPTLDFEHDDTFFDINGLNFLLGTKHHQLLIDLYIEKKCYKTAIRVVNSRSKLHINQIQPIGENHGRSEKEERSVYYQRSAALEHLGVQQ